MFFFQLHLFVSSFHTFALMFSSFLWCIFLFFCFIPIYLSFLALVLLSFSVLILSHPSSFLPPPALPTVGKCGVVRVLAWTGTPLDAVALPGPNSLAPVVMWTSSRRPQQHHLSSSTPSISIRKMDKTPF